MSELSDIICEVENNFGRLPQNREKFIRRICVIGDLSVQTIRMIMAREKIDLDALCVECVREIINTDNQTVAIFYHPHTWSQIGDDLPLTLKESGFNVLILSVGIAPSWCLPVDRELLRRMDMLSACIGTRLPTWLTLATDGLSSLPVIHINRTARTFFDANPRKDQCETLLMLRWGKYVALPVRNSTKNSREVEITQVTLPKDVLGDRNETFVLPLVPSKLERIARIRANLKRNEINRILVSPSVSNLNSYFITSHGVELIEGLLVRFPDHLIVYRPRPEDRENEEVQEVVRVSQNYRNFIFDDVDDYVESYARGVLLITDRSSTGQTFAIATRQPSISFPKDGKFDGVTLTELRGVGCFKVGSIDEIYTKCAEIIADPLRYEDRISEIVDHTYSKCFGFNEKFIEYLKCILSHKISCDWYRISIPKHNIENSDIAGYESSIHSITNNNLVNVDIYGFDILPRYLELKKQSNELVPAEILNAVSDLYIHTFINGHSTYNVIGRVVRLALHNMMLNDISIDTVQCFEHCVKAIIERGYAPAIESLRSDITHIDAAKIIYSELVYES